MFLPSHPILSCLEAKALEAALLKDEADEWDAMQRAGAAIARAIKEDLREIGGLSHEPRLLVLVGKGHNGGDALLAAHELLATNLSARADVVLCLGEEHLRPLAKRSWEKLRQAGGDRIKLVEGASLNSFERYDVCLDGIFGFQFRPPIDEPTSRLIRTVNEHPHIRLRAAVDLPSGIGVSRTETAFRADFTYATGIVKAPVVDPANEQWVGRARYLDLGFFKTAHPEDSPYRVLLPSILSPLAQLRPAHTDKRTYGHLCVVGGSRSYPGAVLMTVQAALRSGVGLLTAFVPASLAPEYAARLPEAMWVGLPETQNGGLALAGTKLVSEKMARATALVIGPGLGVEPETLALVKEIVRQTETPLLLDADALRPEVVRAAEEKRFVVTPHAGEWQRLGGRGGLRPAKTGGVTSELIAVLKGSPTRIERLHGRSETGPTYFSLFGGPVLARGGSGDLLAGLIGGLLAQKPDDLLLAASRGVVWHGLAADLLARDRGQVAVQTTQLLDYLQPALHCADHAPS